MAQAGTFRAVGAGTPSFDIAYKARAIPFSPASRRWKRLFAAKATMTYYYDQDSKGEWRWRVKAANGRIIADSGKGYSSESECKKDIDWVKDSKDAAVKKK
jgi:uncharacterized protein YegP (UPF0339 family)